MNVQEWEEFWNWLKLNYVCDLEDDDPYVDFEEHKRQWESKEICKECGHRGLNDGIEYNKSYIVRTWKLCPNCYNIYDAVDKWNDAKEHAINDIEDEIYTVRNIRYIIEAFDIKESELRSEWTKAIARDNAKSLAHLKERIERKLIKDGEMGSN